MSRKHFAILFFTLIFIGGAVKLSAQVKVGDNPKAIQPASILELESTKKGLLLTRLSDTLLINALNPPNGMVIFYNNASHQQMMVRRYNKWVDVVSSDSISYYVNLIAKNITSNSSAINISNGTGATLQSVTVNFDSTAIGHWLQAHPLNDSLALALTKHPTIDTINSLIKSDILNNTTIDSVLAVSFIKSPEKDSIISVVSNNILSNGKIDTSLAKVIRTKPLTDSIYQSVLDHGKNLTSSSTPISVTGGTGTTLLNTSIKLDSTALGHWLTNSPLNDSMAIALTKHPTRDTLLSLVGSTVNASNGLTKIAGPTIILGGTLSQPTIINSSATNTLSITGLQNGNQMNDSIVVSETNTSALKKVAASNLVTVKQVIYTAAGGQTDFITPLNITDVNKITVFRNGANIEFTQKSTNAITLENDVICSANDEIKIVQVY